MKKLLYTSALLLCLLTSSGTLAQSADFGYSVTPDTTSVSPDPVGSPAASFAVSQLGAATYTIPIEVPQGLPGATPQVAITYNSQAGNGVAGYGCSITAGSVISRVPRDIYHDGAAAGISYTADDAFSLDGRRLILTQAAGGSDSAVYCVEDNPYARVVIHGLAASAQSATWFSVEDTDGMRYEYKTRQYCYQDGQSWVGAWYITKAMTPVGNTIAYTYSLDGYTQYLSQINYGKYSWNRIKFEYEARPDTIRFSQKGVRGYVGRRLKTVTPASYSGGQWHTYRQYALSYDDTGDASTTRFSRLVSVTVANGDGEEMRPLQLEWENLPEYTADIQLEDIDYYGFQDARFVEVVDGQSQLMAADLNGDGISDIIQKANVKVKPGNGSVYYYTDFYIRASGRDSQGNIIFKSPQVFRLDPSVSVSNWSVYSEGPMTGDMDGDGLGDLAIPYIETGVNHIAHFYLIYGEDIRDYNNIVYFKNCQLLHSNTTPLYSATDIDGDGMADIVIIETDNAGGNAYDMHIIPGASSHTSSANVSHCQLNIPSKPEKLFTADFNLDGMPDVMVTYNGGYTIFWNQGGSNLAAIVSTASELTVSQFPSGYRMYEGDYNGDGIQDFLITYKNNSQWKFALGRGDGHFDLSVACDIQAYEQSATGKDDPYLSCSILDIDGDGKSDAVISKAIYAKHHDLFSTYYRFDQVNTYWLLSDGEKLTTKATYTSGQPEYAANQYYMTGDFNGDGLCELANFGYNCDGSSTPANDRMTRIYTSAVYSPASGRLSEVTDALGNRTEIEYASLTEPSVYSTVNETVQGTACVTFPLGVTKSTTSGNGGAETEHHQYTYGGLRVSLQGKGILGFTSFTSTCQELGTTISREVSSWDTEAYLPLNVTERTTENGEVMLRSIVNGKVHPLAGKKAYLAYTGTLSVADFDGDSVVTTQNYDAETGVPTYKKTTSTDGISQTVQYEYIPVGMRWLPRMTVMTRSCFGSADFRTLGTYTYDAKGQLITETLNDSTAAAVTNTYTYDTYGNVLTATTQDVAGALEPVMTTYQYDTSGRFVTRSVERGYMEHVYTHDLWGNILTDTDKTRPGYPLTTTYTYDGWNRQTSSTSPEGLLATRSMGWGSMLSRRYYVLEQAVGKPWVKTWYDSRGREVLTERVGQGDVQEQTATSYDVRGLVTQRKVWRASSAPTQTITQSYTYDGRGRVLSDSRSTDETTTYSYGRRTVSSTSAGRTWTTKFDLQGNVVETTDPLGTVTTYHYHACGQPLSVTSCGSTVTMDYDDAGRQTALHDPDAGTMMYAYDAYGRLTAQTDARGYTTLTTYDDKGRVATTRVTRTPDAQESNYLATVYTYGQSAGDRGLLLSIVQNRYAAQYVLPQQGVAYTYNQYGRVSAETRTLGGGTGAQSWTFAYAYNTAGQLASTSYPGGLTAAYTYDAYGNRSATSVNGQTLEQVQKVTPNTVEKKLGTQLLLRHSLNNRGQTISSLMTRANGSTVPYCSMAFGYASATGLQTYRVGMITGTEYFTYDALDRLTGVQVGSSGEQQTFGYAPNGNMTWKTGVGRYYYDDERPHAVMGVENHDGTIPLAPQKVRFGDIGKVSRITDEGTGYAMSFTYGVDNERISSTLLRGDTVLRTTYYLGDYEEEHTDSTVRRLYYLGGNILYIQEDGGIGQPYFLFTDPLGSIVCIADQTGSLVFRASYDAWGRQTVQQNTIGFRRGYTGHEMMPEFGLINMNGRLYDPVTARFLATDNFVQEPWNSQNLNRYSYCLNNPMMYTDPSGEFMHLVFGAIIGGTVNWAAHGCKLNAKGLGYFGVGALAGAIGAGIGAGISSALPITGQTAGGFAAGFWGTSSATTATSSFFSGALIGGGAGFSGGFVSGFGNALVDGSSFGGAFKHGGINALLGGVSGAAIGGIVGGIDAVRDGRNFLHGGRITDDVNIDMPIMHQVGELDCRYEVFRSNDTYFNGEAMSVEELRRMYPNVETSDFQMANMYGRIGRLGLEEMQVSNLSKVDMAHAMINEASKGKTLIYEMSITPKYAHAVAVTKIRIYDNGRVLLKFMNPSGAGGFSTSNMNNLRRLFNVFKVH